MYNISAYIERRRDRSYAFREDELPSSRVDSLLGLIYSPQPSAERYARRCNFKVHGLCRLIRQSYYLAAVTNLHHSSSSSSKRRDPSVRFDFQQSTNLSTKLYKLIRVSKLLMSSLNRSCVSCLFCSAISASSLLLLLTCVSSSSTTRRRCAIQCRKWNVAAVQR